MQYHQFYNNLYREEKLQKLCSVMGVKKVHDPDSTYELTMDNVKKILAIYMRFRWAYILQKRNCTMHVVNFGSKQWFKFIADSSFFNKI